MSLVGVVDLAALTAAIVAKCDVRQESEVFSAGPAWRCMQGGESDGRFQRAVVFAQRVR